MGVRFETNDLEAARDELRRQYGSVRLRAGGERHRLRMAHDGLGPLLFSRVTFGMTFTADVPPIGVHMFGQVISGRLAIEARRRYDRYRPGDAYLVARPEAYYRTYVSELDTDMVTVPDHLIAEVAEADPARRAGPVVFTGYHPQSAVTLGFWNETCSYVRQVMETPAGVEPLVAGQVSRLLVAAALTSFPNTARPEPTPVDRRDAHPATVRRAMAYIEEHAQDDISPADIAAAAFVSIRAVQLAFRAHLGTTPMAYLRRVRLHHVHQQLLAADPARVTVGDVAARWGFANQSRFSARYRAEFGVPPSHTLRQD